LARGRDEELVKFVRVRKKRERESSSIERDHRERERVEKVKGEILFFVMKLFFFCIKVLSYK